MCNKSKAGFKLEMWQLLGYDDAKYNFTNASICFWVKKKKKKTSSHSVSSLPSSQSFMPSHLQAVGIHSVLDLHDHWNSAQFSGARGQS